MSVTRVQGNGLHVLPGGTGADIRPADEQVNIVQHQDLDRGPIDEAARTVAVMNKSMGGINPLLLETAGLLKSASVKPNRMYYHSGTEYYHPQLSLSDLLGIGTMYKGEHYQSVAASIGNTEWPVDFSAIYLHLYTDQADGIYDKLLQKHPQEIKKPYEKDKGPKFTYLGNLLRPSPVIERELQQRKEEQKQVTQRIVDHLKRLNDPGIEEICLPTPDEHHEKYRCPLQQAALCDAIIIIHKKVPPVEQRGIEAYRREQPGLLLAGKEEAAHAEPAAPPVAALTLGVQAPSKFQDFFLKTWIQVKKLLLCLFCWWR